MPPGAPSACEVLCWYKAKGYRTCYASPTGCYYTVIVTMGMGDIVHIETTVNVHCRDVEYVPGL